MLSRGGAAYHPVKGVYCCEGGGVVKGRILVRRAAFTNDGGLSLRHNDGGRLKSLRTSLTKIICPEPLRDNQFWSHPVRARQILPTVWRRKSKCLFDFFIFMVLYKKAPAAAEKKNITNLGVFTEKYSYNTRSFQKLEYEV